MQGETIICIAPRAWDALWRETQPVMARFAAQNRVVYIEPGRDSDQPVAAEFIRHLPDLFHLRCRQVLPGLTVVSSPSSLPHARYHLSAAILRVTLPAAVAINVRVLRWHVRRVMRALEVHSPILFIYKPYDVGVVGTLGEKLACYHNYDEFSEFTRNRRIKGQIKRLDEALCRRVDLVFATSTAQVERRRAINPHTYFVPNGVDFTLFNRALAADLVLPEDIAPLPRPRIGFAGWLGYHIDIALLLAVAQAFPQGSLVLVGPDDLPASPLLNRLRQLSNVHFLGSKARDAVPGYLRAFDVALIPHSLEGHTRWAYPLKLHEYLAAGRAIVASPLPELEPYREIVRIAHSPNEFVAQVTDALDDYAPDRVKARVAIAQQNTWDHRVAEMVRHIDRHLSDGSASPRVPERRAGEMTR